MVHVRCRGGGKDETVGKIEEGVAEAASVPPPLTDCKSDDKDEVLSCHRCQQTFGSASELSYHLKRAVCQRRAMGPSKAGRPPAGGLRMCAGPTRSTSGSCSESDAKGKGGGIAFGAGGDNIGGKSSEKPRLDLMSKDGQDSPATTSIGSTANSNGTFNATADAKSWVPTAADELELEEAALRLETKTMSSSCSSTLKGQAIAAAPKALASVAASSKKPDIPGSAEATDPPASDINILSTVATPGTESSTNAGATAAGSKEPETRSSAATAAAAAAAAAAASADPSACVIAARKGKAPEAYDSSDDERSIVMTQTPIKASNQIKACAKSDDMDEDMDEIIPSSVNEVNSPQNSTDDRKSAEEPSDLHLGKSNKCSVEGCVNYKQAQCNGMCISHFKSTQKKGAVSPPLLSDDSETTATKLKAEKEDEEKESIDCIAQDAGPAKVSAQSIAQQRQRQRRTEPRLPSIYHCGKCDGCMIEDCGSCINCTDMPRFGGKWTNRHKCSNRPPCLDPPSLKKTKNCTNMGTARHARTSITAPTTLANANDARPDINVGEAVWVRQPGSTKYYGDPATVLSIDNDDDAKDQDVVCVRYTTARSRDKVSPDRIKKIDDNQSRKRKRGRCTVDGCTEQCHEKERTRMCIFHGNTTKNKDCKPAAAPTAPVSLNGKDPLAASAAPGPSNGKGALAPKGSYRLCSVRGCTKNGRGADHEHMCRYHYKQSKGEESRPWSGARISADRRLPAKNGCLQQVPPQTVSLSSSSAAPSRDSFISKMHHAMEWSSLAEVKRIFGVARKSLSESFSEVDIEHIVRGWVTNIHRRPTSDGGIFGCTLMHVWAYLRYDDDDTEPKKGFLRAIDKDRDALDCLNFLLECGADVHAKTTDKQTVLHIACSLGYTNVLNALLKTFDFSLNDLLVLDDTGETPVHAAISNENIGCIEMIMTNIYERFEVKDWVEWVGQIKDADGNNILMQLVRYTDVWYYRSHEECRQSTSKSKTFRLLKQHLGLIKEYEQFGLLLDENHEGDNVLCVAAKMGQIHEAKALSDILIEGTKRSIANRCGAVRRESGEIAEQVSPLQWAMETRDMLARSVGASNSQKHFIMAKLSSRGVSALEQYFEDDTRLKNWLDSAERAVEHLEKISTNKAVPLSFVEKFRETNIATKQRLSSESKNLKSRFQRKHREKGGPEISSPYSHKAWRNQINGKGKEARKIQKEIKAVLGLGKTSAAHKTPPNVETRLICDPTHPCLRSSMDPVALQFGLFARKKIPSGTVICEYTGKITREDGHYARESEYTVQLHALDSYVEKKEGTIYGNTFLLDAANYFNEGAMVNDVRTHDVGEKEEHRRENCEYVEVEWNGWPHLLVCCTTEIKANEELTVDYGPSYWQKKANITKDEQIRTQEAEINRLRQELIDTRRE